VRGRDVPVSTRRLLLGGVLGPILFVALIQAQDLTRPGYDSARQFISVLGLGDEGWVQALNFIVSGLLIAGLGIGLARTADGRRATLVGRLITVMGLAIAFSGLFPSDPQLGYPHWISAEEVANPTLHSRLHFLGGFVATSAFALAAGIDGWTRLRAGHRWSAAYVFASAAVMLGCFLAGLAMESPGIGVPAIGGLLQRIGLVAGLQWLVALAVGELRLTTRRPDTPFLAGEPHWDWR